MLAAASGAFALVQWVSVDREPAVWAIDGEVGESSLVIPIRAAHASCPSWATLGGLVVEAVETDTQVAIYATFPEHDADTACEWLGASMSAKVKLTEPLGDRQVIDGATGADPGDTGVAGVPHRPGRRRLTVRPAAR